MDRERSSASQCEGTSCRFKSGLTDNSEHRNMSVARARQGPQPRTLSSKVKQGREIFAIRHLGSFRPQFVKEWVRHRLHCTQPSRRRILEQLLNHVYRLWCSAWSEHLHRRIVSHCPTIAQPHVIYLVERMGLDLGELVLHIIGIHRLDLFSGRRTENLDNLDQLIDAAFARKQWLAQHQLGHYTSC